VATFSDLFARLDPDPRVRGKQFEHVCKWFLTNDPTYKNTLRRVWLWSEWTGRWGRQHSEGGVGCSETEPIFLSRRGSGVLDNLAHGRFQNRQHFLR
jgi:hypothetical protein